MAILDLLAEPGRVLVALQVIRPGVVVDAIGEVQEQQQVLMENLYLPFRKMQKLLL